MNPTTQKTEKIAALCGMIWFATIIDACFTWFFPWIFRYFIGTPLVIYATLQLRQNNSLIASVQRRKLFILFFSLFCFVSITQISLSAFIRYPLLYIPIFCLVFWPKTVLDRFYVYLKRFIVFYAIVSIIVELLVISGVYTKLPCLIIPPQDNVQENHGIINRFYFLFVIPESVNGLVLYRAMGPLREGGHFSIFLGFVYFVEKALSYKRNVWIIIAGLLTLSPNFVFFFIIAEGYAGIVRKRIVKTLIGLVILVFLVVGVVLLSPAFIQDEIVRVVLERSLNNSMENAETGGYMELLDGRTNIEGLQMWNRFVGHTDLFTRMTGMREFDEHFVLSDFRCLIYSFGYVGFLLILICSVRISFFGKKDLYGLCVLLLGLWVMTSRAWMFQQLYIWTMMLLAVNRKLELDSCSCHICSNISNQK